MISSTTLEPGVVLLGKYRVDRVLGAGGMGMVLLAHHLQLQRPVAIKVLLPAMVAQREIVQRFLREAQAASRLTSEHVARVLDVGSLPDGAPYMVLEYLDGTDLARIGPGTLPTTVMIDLVLQACEALAEAHALGIVHRDLKPANLFVTRRADGEPQLKLLDFGISKTGSVADDRLTSTHSVMGTPSYMSPEQMRASREVDARADVWSLGAVLYELFQGAPPFEAETFTALCLAVTMDPPAPLTAAIPTRLRDAVLRCLEKAPASRFQSVGELAEALAPFASSPARAAMSVERIARTLASAPPAFRATVGSREASTTLRNAAGARTERNRARVETTRGRRAGAIIAGVAVAAGVVAAAAWRVDRHAETRLGAPVGSAPEPAPPERALDASPSASAPPTDARVADASPSADGTSATPSTDMVSNGAARGGNRTPHKTPPGSDGVRVPPPAPTPEPTPEPTPTPIPQPTATPAADGSTTGPSRTTPPVGDHTVDPFRSDTR